jgi:hypothetical protein
LVDMAAAGSPKMLIPSIQIHSTTSQSTVILIPLWEPQMKHAYCKAEVQTFNFTITLLPLLLVIPSNNSKSCFFLAPLQPEGCWFL